ncbi:hypothetical protein ACFOOP_08985 [Marinicaulis aureus]|uniref:Uncharacterized protein n=1 Tax=Hyphococcus aureus TaxID=2666033 RepID=A0ABW1KSF8_9PROT
MMTGPWAIAALDSPSKLALAQKKLSRRLQDERHAIIDLLLCDCPVLANAGLIFPH